MTHLRALLARRAIPIVAVAVLVVDQITKALCIAEIPLHARIPLIDGYLALTHVHNRGMAFGLFNGVGAPWLRWVLAAVAVAAVVIIWFYARQETASPVVAVAFGAVLGGAIGNLADRLRYGYVEDFILAHWGPHEWPAFNVADAAITMGGITLFLALARDPDRADEAPGEAPAGEAGHDVPPSGTDDIST